MVRGRGARLGTLAIEARFAPTVRFADGVGAKRLPKKARRAAGLPSPLREAANHFRSSPFNASLMPPTAFWTLPLTLSILPSASSFESPVSLPAPSFTLPFMFVIEPSTRSLSAMTVLLRGGVSREQRGAGGPVPAPAAASVPHAFAARAFADRPSSRGRRAPTPHDGRTLSRHRRAGRRGRRLAPERAAGRA